MRDTVHDSMIVLKNVLFVVLQIQNFKPMLLTYLMILSTKSSYWIEDRTSSINSKFLKICIVRSKRYGWTDTTNIYADLRSLSRRSQSKMTDFIHMNMQLWLQWYRKSEDDNIFTEIQTGIQNLTKTILYKLRITAKTTNRHTHLNQILPIWPCYYAYTHSILQLFELAYLLSHLTFSIEYKYAEIWDQCYG